MKWLVTIVQVLLCSGGLLMSACGKGGVTTNETGRIDSLNRLSYDDRYRNLKESGRLALLAYEASEGYELGRMEALNNLAFADFMNLDFETAERRYKEVLETTNNELELLIADVGLMKIYQRTSQNKAFYDARNDALHRIKRIVEEENLLNENGRLERWVYARSEFYIVSAIYHYYLQQQPEAEEAIRRVEPEENFSKDSAQRLYYQYIKASAGLCGEETTERERLAEFDGLYTVWKKSANQNYLYFLGNSLQGLANLMVAEDDFRFFLSRRSYALKQFGMPVDSLFPMRLAEKALEYFEQYDDWYQITAALVSQAKYLNYHGRYTEAQKILEQALKHADLRLKRIPEMLASIYEQLSVSYAGLEEKQLSDTYRNKYLDLLDEIRQDKKLESRYQVLQAESEHLNRLLAMAIACLVLLLLGGYYFYLRAGKNNERQLHRLHRLLEVCRKITASIPPNVQSEEEVLLSVEKGVGSDLIELFEKEQVKIEKEGLTFSHKLSKENEAMARVINPYIRWALHNGRTSATLQEEQLRWEKQLFVHEQHLVSNKRQNILKKACFSIVYGIQPCIDRLTNEIHKLMERRFAEDALLKAEKYRYIDELVSAINDYNDVLSLWIKMRQGVVGLNITSFDLDEVFDLIQKGSRTFEAKKLCLEVEPTSYWVKADKALTLFMVNTLVENARKFTQSGGKVRVFARKTADYVEISVSDTGCGLSPKDVSRLVSEKVYDSREIGLESAPDKEALLRTKGNGFGLMNCKGIIEKYRKSNELFNVCLFDVESTVGKGSRFYFRLPVGIRKSLLMVGVMAGGLMSCTTSSERSGTTLQSDSLAISIDTLSVEESEGEYLLDIASAYANEAYYSNVEGLYEQTLLYADSAITCLNTHRRLYASFFEEPMQLVGEGTPAELGWWNSSFDTDFHVILDIRNEVAVASLALKRWNVYTYNNMIYTNLYKLLGQDNSLEEYCRRLERTTGHQTISVMLAILCLVALLLGYWVFYYRRYVLNRWRLEQVLEINNLVSSASIISLEGEEGGENEEEILQQIPSRIVHKIFAGINELMSVERMVLAVYNETTRRLDVASSSEEKNREKASENKLRTLVEQCFSEQQYMVQGGLQALPLLVKSGEEERCIGVLCVERQEDVLPEHDYLLLKLVTQYIGIVVFNAVIKLSGKYRDIELIQNDVRRVAWEENQLHVQNLILDNSLSTIKHETIYYPSKIKQLLVKLQSGELTEGEEQEAVATLTELVDFYQGIFTLLSQSTSVQQKEVTFRRTSIEVNALTQYAEKYFRKRLKKSSAKLNFRSSVSTSGLMVSGDLYLIRFLLENLLNEAISVPVDGKLKFTVGVENDFVRFTFIDYRRSYPLEMLNQLFYPDKERMVENERGELMATEYLLCKQVIREHDEFGGVRGCRINAEELKSGEGGFCVYFTLPLAGKNKGKHQENV